MLIKTVQVELVHTVRWKIVKAISQSEMCLKDAVWNYIHIVRSPLDTVTTLANSIDGAELFFAYRHFKFSHYHHHSQAFPIINYYCAINEKKWLTADTWADTLNYCLQHCLIILQLRCIDCYRLFNKCSIFIRIFLCVCEQIFPSLRIEYLAHLNEDTKIDNLNWSIMYCKCIAFSVMIVHLVSVPLE